MTGRALGICALLLIQTVALRAQLPVAPPQPTSGPGGSAYSNGAAIWSGPFYARPLDSATQYYLLEPAMPKLASAPVVFFLHGWLAYDPNEYAGWMYHMARNGYTVVWAQYDDGVINTWKWSGNAIAVLQDALKRLNSLGHVKPEADSQGRPNVAFVGHSAGAYIGAILAAKSNWWWYGIPQPKALVAIAPGGKGLIPSDYFSLIQASTKIVITVGEDDTTVCTLTALDIWNNIGQVPNTNKNFLLVRTDSRGTPALVADHFFANTTGKLETAAVDARDFFITYKLSVAALDCAFRNRNCTAALGAGAPVQVGMGSWSDGVPVKTMLYSDDPNTLTPACLQRWPWSSLK